MNKQQLINKAKLNGYVANTNKQYLFKDLGNGYITSIQWWGEDTNPHIIAVHKDQCIQRGSNPYYTDYNHSNHIELKNVPAGVKVNRRYIALPNGTTYPNRYAELALEALENRLSK